MLTQTHFTDFKIRAFEGLSIIARHYETLRASYDGSRRGTKVYENDVYDETKKPQERQPREANLFIFLTLILNLGRVLNVNIHKLG
jgi:hypothetical protein